MLIVLFNFDFLFAIETLKLLTIDFLLSLRGSSFKFSNLCFNFFNDDKDFGTICRFGVLHASAEEF
jgi:hypothetical protein